MRPRVSEDLYSSLFQKNHAVMLIIDPRDGRIVDANQAAIRFYGYTAWKLKTLRISDINMLDAGEVRLKMNQAIKKSRRYFIFQHRLADGTIRDVEVYSGPVTIKGRKLLYSIVHEITERKRAAEALRLSEKKYRQISRERLSPAGLGSSCVLRAFAPQSQPMDPMARNAGL